MQWLAFTCSMALVAACGGEPVGSHVPRPNPAHVAGAAAAAATALTVADPDGAGKKPETADDGREPRAVDVDESVPGDVLDRAEAGKTADADEAADADEPCPAPETGTLELLPRVVDEATRSRRCKSASAEPDAAPRD